MFSQQKHNTIWLIITKPDVPKHKCNKFLNQIIIFIISFLNQFSSKTFDVKEGKCQTDKLAVSFPLHSIFFFILSTEIKENQYLFIVLCKINRKTLIHKLLNFNNVMHRVLFFSQLNFTLSFSFNTRPKTTNLETISVFNSPH